MVATEDSGVSAIRVRHITKAFKSYDGDLLALDDVCCDIPKGGITVISGCNGSGKTLLMKIIGGLIKSDCGKVILSDGIRPGLVFQNVREGILGDSAIEDVMISIRMRGGRKAKIEQEALAVLEKVGLSEKAGRQSHSLSAGEARRLALASVLALDRNVVFLDEPYSNLDYPGVKDVNRLLCSLAEGGKTIVLITHELEKCLGLAKKIIVLSQGRLAYDGDCADAVDRLERWGIHNPLTGASRLENAVWI